MENSDGLTIGYVPARRNVFSRKDALKYKILTLGKIESFRADLILPVSDMQEE